MYLATSVASQLGNSMAVYLLAVLSLFVLVIAVERAIVLISSRDDIARLRAELGRLLARGETGIALGRLEASPSYEARIVAAGLAAHRGSSAHERMIGERQLARLAMEHNLGLLWAIGYAAPLVGLGGCVVGVVRAFRASAASPMLDVREAVAVALIGLGVAVPAIALSRLFERVIRERIARADALGREVLAYLEDREG